MQETAAQALGDGPLTGVRVVDLSLLLPGPLCSMHLGDMGADVVKVENPRAADMTRYMGVRMQGPGDVSESSIFLMLNRNKRAITLNLKRPEGREVLLKLLADADILLEGFRPGTLANMGLGYDDLCERFPRLIYCAISGYGATGPYRDLAGHDGNYMAHAGVLGLTGQAEGPPVLPGVQIADIGGGTQAALVSILAALYARERTGKGQFLDIAMMEGAFSFLSLHAGELAARGTSPERGRMILSGGLPNYNIYRCADDRYVMLGALEERFFKAFLRKVGRLDLLEGRELTPEGLADVKPELTALFAGRTLADWSELFTETECCLAPVNTVSEAFEDPQLRARGMVVTMKHPEIGEILMIGAPFRFSDTPCSYRRPPPAHGQHTAEILAELGYQDGEIEALRRQRAV